MLETLRPDPTFYPSPKLAMEAPAENYAYVLMLSPDGSQPDALGVVDVQLGSTTYGTLVHTVVMPNKGDEFHHFGWNACSSALSPLTGHAFLRRRFLAGARPVVLHRDDIGGPLEVGALTFGRGTQETQ